MELNQDIADVIKTFQAYAKKHKFKSISLQVKDNILDIEVGNLNFQHFYKADDIQISILSNIKIQSIINFNVNKDYVVMTFKNQNNTTFTTSWMNEFQEITRNSFILNDIQFIQKKELKHLIQIKDLKLLYEFTDNKGGDDSLGYVLLNKNYTASSDGGRMISIDRVLADHSDILLHHKDLKNILDIFKKHKTISYSLTPDSVVFTDVDRIFYTYNLPDCNLRYPNYQDLAVPPKDLPLTDRKIDLKEFKNAVKILKTTDICNVIKIDKDSLSTPLSETNQEVRLITNKNLPKHYINKDYLKSMCLVADVFNDRHLTLSYPIIELMDGDYRDGIEHPIYQRNGRYTAVYMPLNPKKFNLE